MNFVNKLVELMPARAPNHVVQYFAFALFGTINSCAYLYETLTHQNHLELSLGVISIILCLLLFLRNRWPEEVIGFLPLYFYTVIMVTGPMISTYTLLMSNWSLEWLMNFNISAMVLIFLLESLTAFVVGAIGVLCGTAIVYLSGHSLIYNSHPEHLYISIYVFLYIVVLGYLISRRRENSHSDLLLKAKTDMSEKLEEKVHERTIELERALTFKTEFLNNMSHEIRTPVQGICGISEGLVDNWEKLADPKRFESVQLIAKNSKRIFALLCNLLDLSKFEAGMMKLEFRRFNLNAALDDIIDECTTLYFKEKEIKFTFKHAKDALVVADLERITQVLRNIFFNAIKFSSKSSSVSAKITHTVLPAEGSALQVSISDQGVGIPAKDLESIFHNFTQSEVVSKKTGGTGLGLPICKSIIELHGGKIWAENNKDKGATFHFIIPTTQPGHSLDVVEQHKNPANDLSILMIDDEGSCFASLEMMLMDTNCNLIRAETGSEGLAYLKSHPKEVDVIFLDLMMPDMYGYDVLQAIKEDESIASIPVIMQSGAPDDEEIKKCFDIGLAGYIRKPYQKKDVIAALDKYVK